MTSSELFDAPDYLRSDARVTTHANQLLSVEDIRSYLFAGHATLTLKSRRTGRHYTYRVKLAPDKKPDALETERYFIMILHGGDEWRYIGLLSEERGFSPVNAAKKHKFSRWDEAPALPVHERAFKWFAEKLLAGSVDAQLEVWHEGKCGRCGRALTHPDSIERGIGPECAVEMGLL